MVFQLLFIALVINLNLLTSLLCVVEPSLYVNSSICEHLFGPVIFQQ